MSAFADKLRAETQSWNPANAPKGMPTCPNCRRRERAEQAGEHYVWCTAEPIMPAFTAATFGNSMSGHVGHPINLAHFDPASSYAERLNRKVCPLFEQAA